MPISWRELLTNRELYPDDREITLSDGEKVTVGSLRNEAMPKADFTRASQQWADRERQLTAANEAYAQALQERQQEQQQTRPGTPLTWKDIAQDPVLGMLAKEVEELKAARAQHEQFYLRDQYRATLSRLKFQDDQDQKNFVDYAIRNQLPNLDIAHQVYTRQRDMDQAVKEAETRGLERGRKEGRAPIPNGSRAVVDAAAPIPKSFNDPAHLERAMSDPDILAAMRGDAP